MYIVLLQNLHEVQLDESIGILDDISTIAFASWITGVGLIVFLVIWYKSISRKIFISYDIGGLIVSILSLPIGILLVLFIILFSRACIKFVKWGEEKGDKHLFADLE